MSDEHIIIDGYNAIFRAAVLRDQAREDLERARSELVRRIDEAFRGRRERVTVVFDGNRGVAPGRAPRQGGQVRVVFSSPPETADERIQRLVEDGRRAAHGARRLNVRIVSSDREVAGRARLWGAKAIGVEDFLREVEVNRGRAAESRSASEPAGPRRRKRGGGGGTAPAAGGAEPGPGEHPAKPGLPGSAEVEAWERLFRDRRRRRAADGDPDEE